MSWETVIGLEVHVQLATKTKIFSGSSTRFGASPNTQACAIDLAMPGRAATEGDGAEKTCPRDAFGVVFYQIAAKGVAERVRGESTGERLEASMQSVREERCESEV